MSNEEIYEKLFYNTEVPPQDTFDRRVALSAMDAARKDEAERVMAEVLRRVTLIKSEPNGLVRETMIENITIDI